MKATYILLLLVLTKPIDLFSQDIQSKKDSIVWDRNYKLKWSDFMGAPDTSSAWMAGCAPSIYVRGYWENNLPNFLVSNSFIRNKAWTKDVTSIPMLRHEQLHFDIAEVYSRKIRKAVDSLRRMEVRTFEPYSIEIRTLLNLYDETDRIYDDETSHGVNGNVQSNWCQRIAEELNVLNKYADDRSLKKISH